MFLLTKTCAKSIHIHDDTVYYYRTFKGVCQGFWGIFSKISLSYFGPDFGKNAGDELLSKS
jgi:hypothetical protein